MGPPCDPKSYWKVYNGGLYCNYNSGAASNFASDIDSMIAAADERWISYYGSLQAGPFNAGCLADCFQSTCSCMRDCSYGYCGNSASSTA